MIYRQSGAVAACRGASIGVLAKGGASFAFDCAYRSVSSICLYMFTQYLVTCYCVSLLSLYILCYMLYSYIVTLFRCL